MKIYNVRAFRINLKEAFILAAEDKDVFVKRDGKYYKLDLTINQDRCREYERATKE